VNVTGDGGVVTPSILSHQSRSEIDERCAASYGTAYAALLAVEHLAERGSGLR
jgi:hypothetical protein